MAGLVDGKSAFDIVDKVQVVLGLFFGMGVEGLRGRMGGRMGNRMGGRIRGYTRLLETRKFTVGFDILLRLATMLVS